MTFPARLTELIEKATKGPIIAYEDVQEAGKLKLFFSAIKDSNGENLVRASGAQSMSDFLLWAYLVNHAEAIRDLVVAAEKAAKMQIVEQWELQEALASLGHEKLDTIESQPVPVEPVCVKAMRMFANNGNTDAKEGVEYIDSLQSALHRAQEKYEQAVSNKQIAEAQCAELLQRAEKAESRNKRLVELLRKLLVTMRHATFFITSREKMHETGVELWNQEIAETAELLREVDK